MTQTKTLRTAFAAAGAVLALAVSGCADDTNVSGGGGDAAEGGSIADDYDLEGASLTVGSKEFTENKVLGQITIAALQAAGADVEDKTGISGTDTVRAALESGEIDMYWDYTGTGWVNILGNTTEQLPEDLFAAVSEADAANNVTWIGPAPLNNTYAIAVTSDFAEENDIASLGDAAEYMNANPDEGTICAASEFLNRDDGLTGLEAAYGVKYDVVEIDLNLVYPQLGKDCNFGEVTATDARVKENDLVVLEDDKDFFVPYNGALTVKTEVVDEYADITPMFEEIAEGLTDDVMIELNAKVDLDGEKEADVAQQYLKDEGFIG